MSKAEKMQKRLANLQKEREEFERQKQQLEMEMNIGKKNMGKIQKSLKNHLHDIELLDTDSVLTDMNTAKDTSRGISRKVSNGKPQLFSMNTSSSAIAAAAAGGTGTGADKAALDTLDEHQHPVIVPSGPRISDWPFTAPLDSSPPVVKSRDLYENIRLLGRGSFGEVNLAKNVEDHKLFAIKTIFCSRDSELQSVMRELKFLRMNHHPFVIDVHDAFITSNPRVVHIVMHYCESGTLSSVIQAAKRNKNMISESQVLKWVVQLALAMHCLHENKTMHRDLKPMNVMLTEGGDILKLADFGLAMDMREASKGENFDEAGTPYYTAPEMIQRESYSFPTDCWSFGVILFQLLSLERPFDGASTADLVRSILTNEPPPLPAHYSEDIREICKNLLKKNQSERLTMAQLLCEPLIFGKAAACPQNYRPKHTEERIRRSQSKQLEQQIEVLSKQRKLQATSNTSGKFSSDVSFNGATEGITGLTPRVHADGFLSQFPDPIAIPLINTVIDEGDASLKSLKAKSPHVAKSPYSKSSPSAAAHKQTMAPVTEEELDLMLKATEKTLHHTSHNKNIIEDILHPDQPHRRTHFHSPKASTPHATTSSSGHHVKSTPKAAPSPLASVALDNTYSAAVAVPPLIDPLAVSVEELVQHIDSKIAARQPVGLALPLSARLQKMEAFEADISVLSQKLKEDQDKLEIVVQHDSNEPKNPIADEHVLPAESNAAALSPPLSSRVTDHNGLHSGGRKGRAIAEAIENDHLFEKQLSQEMHSLKQEQS